MAGLAGVQAAIDKGRGAAAAKIGQRYSVYRLNSSSTGQLVQPSNLVASNFPASFMRYTSRKDIETNMIVKVPIFRGLCDVSKLQIGDVLVETGFRGDLSAFTLAYERPLRQYIFMQTPIPATFSRSVSNPQNIQSGEVPFSGMNKATEQVLVLINGMYSFKPAGMYPPAAVYMGLQATEKAGELPPPDQRLPTDVQRQGWDVYCGLLPGVQLVESDLVNAANGDRYFVSIPAVYYSGLQGWLLRTQKLRV